MSTAFVAAPAVVVPEGAGAVALVAGPPWYVRAGWAIADFGKWIWGGIRSGWHFITHGVSRVTGYTKVAAPAAASRVASPIGRAAHAAPIVAKRGIGWLLRGTSALAMWIWNLIVAIFAFVGVGVAVAALVVVAVLIGIALGGAWLSDKYSDKVHRRFQGMSRNTGSRRPWRRSRVIAEELVVPVETPERTGATAVKPEKRELTEDEKLLAEQLRKPVTVSEVVSIDPQRLWDALDTAPVIEIEKFEEYSDSEIEDLIATGQIELPPSVSFDKRQESWKRLSEKVRKEGALGGNSNVHSYLFGRSQAARIYMDNPNLSFRHEIPYLLTKGEDVLSQRNKQANSSGDYSLRLHEEGFRRGVLAEVIALKKKDLHRRAADRSDQEDVNHVVEKQIEVAEAAVSVSDDPPHS